MEELKKKRTFLIIGIVTLIIFVISLFIDSLVKVSFENRDLIFRAIEVLSATSASFSLSVSFSINVSKKSNSINLVGNNDGNVSPINVDSGSVTINYNNDNREIKERLVELSDRIDAVEKTNIERIADKVAEKMKDKEANNVDNDFTMKFVFESKTISNEEIQDIWASLMVSNATTDNKVSRRTLDIVKNLSVEEANKFKTIASLSFKGGIIYKDFVNTIPFIDISLMQDIGLLKGDQTLRNVYSVPPNGTIPLIENDLLILIKNLSNNKKELSYNCHALTSEGLQLKRSIGIEISDELIIEFAKGIKKANKGFDISAHRIISMNPGEEMRYDLKDLTKDE